MLSERRASTGFMPWLALTALAYGLFHHVGSWLSWLGLIGDSRWADWADLCTPFVFLLCAAAALRAGQADRLSWTLYLVGAVIYTEGHGIHLSANSIGNVAPSGIAHLWDEVVGHYLWYTGVAIVFAALALTLARHEPARGAAPYPLAVVVGGTWATNSLEGGTVLLGMAVAAGFIAWGWATRAGLGRLLLVAYVCALAVLIGYGIWQGGFPQPSELGWI
jgi:hypothetical protein